LAASGNYHAASSLELSQLIELTVMIRPPVAPNNAAMNPTSPSPHAPIHPVWMRTTHWLNAVAVLVLVTSGWRIYNAAPFPPADPWLIGKSPTIRTTSRKGVEMVSFDVKFGLMRKVR